MPQTDSHIKWLLRELPELEEKGILSSGSVTDLQSHYQAQLDTQKKFNPVFVITGVLGALLVGAGIISVFAYNWDNLSRPMRIFFSFMPLLIAQGIFTYTFFRNRDSLAWREASSGFLMLMLLSSLSLIAQTYQLGGDVMDLILTWLILSIPLLYLLRSSLVFVIYMIGITSWTLGHVDDGEKIFFYALLAAAIPLYLFHLRQNGEEIRKKLEGWALGLGVLIASFVMPEWSVGGQAVFSLSLLFGFFYISGESLYPDKGFFWNRPFQTIAAVGIFVLALILAYEWHIREIDFGDWWEGHYHPDWVARTNIGIWLAMLVGWILLLRKQLITDKIPNPFLAGFPPVVGLCLILASDEVGGLSVLIMNVFLVLWGVYTLRKGILEEKLANVNAGMFILAAWLVMRFFDRDISFLVKGIVFILIGASFLGVNYYLVKKRNAESHE